MPGWLALAEPTVTCPCRDITTHILPQQAHESEGFSLLRGQSVSMHTSQKVWIGRCQEMENPPLPLGVCSNA